MNIKHQTTNIKHLPQKVITRTILILSLISLFTDIASEMLYPVMPLYLRSIGFTILWIGVLEGLAEATAGFSKGYFGNLSDKIQKRVPFIKMGYSLSAISKPLLVLFIFPLWIFFSRTMDRLGKGLRTGARDAILSAESTPENKGKVFGFHRGMDTLGASIGPLIALGFLFLYPGQYKWLFIGAIIPGALAISLTFLIKDHYSDKPRSSGGVSFFGFLSYWKNSSLNYKRLVIGLLAFTLFNSSDVFLLLILKHHGISDMGMIGFYIFYNLVYALTSYPLGIIADKVGLKKMLITGLVLFALVYLFIAFINSLILLGVLFFIYGIYAAATEGISKAMISNMSKTTETATAIGFYSGFSSILTLLASFIGGLIWAVFGPTWMFVFSGIGVILVVIYFLIISSLKHIKT